MASKCWAALSRRRLDDSDASVSALDRCLGLIDLTALGVGSTLGLGVYVLAGAVAKDTAGPAVCISFLIAAIASAFAGMCYAEFASRVPKAGSAYIYSYVTVGEFIAFIIGWNLILEYVIGTASVARGFSNYLDFLIGNVMSQALRAAMPIDVPWLSEYPDFFAFGMVMLLAILLAVGVKESSLLNNIFTTINLITLSIILVAGSMNADPANWFIDPETIPDNVENPGVGGFMPFGLAGVMAGAARCFYGFVGFDAVATTGEEAKNPQRNIPLAIVISLSIVFVAYFSISTVLTMMWPYYDQNAEAPFPYVFEQIGWPVIKWIVNVGAVFALCTSMLGAMFPLPRVLYAMGSDGIVFKILAKVNSKTQTPMYGTILSGLLAGIMTLIFNLHQLIDMMSIGTLLAYSIVAICVLILRYQPEMPTSNVAFKPHDDRVDRSIMTGFKQLYNLNGLKEPSDFSSGVASWGILAYSIFTLVASYLFTKNVRSILNGNLVLIIPIAILVLMMILIVIAIGRQPVQHTELSFKVPLVPLIPCISVFMNFYLMVQLDIHTWIRFAVWMFVGFCIYFLYGIRYSVQGAKDRVESQAAAKLNGVKADHEKSRL